MGSTQDDILDASQIPFEGDFDQQVEGLLSRVRLTRTEVENLQCLLDDLKNALSYCWPGTRVHPFGSVVTGLGIRTSDVDCYIEVPREFAVRVQSPVKFAKSVLSKDKSRFTQTFAITTARVPILKFVHVKTGFNCDINFSSLSGVRNSKLIAFLLNLDPRALSLAVIIKYWSKVYNFTGTNLMPNYGLTMMVIFYLQVKSVLPSVVELQRHTRRQWVEGWNTAFNDNFMYVPDNVQSLYELLGGFFNYYKNFDYAQFVISPYLGYPVKKQELEDVHNLPNVYNLYKDNVLSERCGVIKLDTVICIQDPFEHSRNCSVAVFPKLFNKIQALIELALKAFREKPDKDFLRQLFSLDVPRELKIDNKLKPNFRKHKKRTNKFQRQSQEEHIRNYYKQWQRYKCFNGPVQ